MGVSRGLVALAALLGGAILTAVPAAAQVAVAERSPESVTAADRPFFLSLGGGANFLFSNTCHPPSCGIYTSDGNAVTGAGAWVGAEVGANVLPVDEHPGLRLTGSGAMSIGPAYGWRFGARLSFDIQLFRLEDADVSFLLTPSVLAGFAIVVDLGGPFFIAIEPALDIHVLLFRGVFGVWLRPVAIDIQFMGPFTTRWNLVAGAELRL